MKLLSRTLVLFALVAVVVVPSLADAAGLVPQCGGIGGEPCQACHLMQLINSVITWVIGVLTVVAGLLFAFAGIRLVTSGGNADAKKYAKDLFINVTIGYLILLGGWLLIDTLMKALLKDQAYGVWHIIQCAQQPQVRLVHPAGYEGRSRGVAYTGANLGGAFSPEQANSLAGLNAPDDKVAAAAAAAGLSPEQARNLQALMRVESGGCRNMYSPAGAVGCMQIMPGTARQYDNTLQGLSDAQIRERLMNNDYNIALGTRIYTNLYRQYNGDTTRVFAAYNGGEGANAPSRDCPGLLRWQCQWDSPGCHGTTNTSCTPNRGYIETRNYVQRIPQVAAQLPR